MDTWAIGIFIVGAVLYFVTKRQAIWLFVMGVGVGLFAGAVWAALIVQDLIRGLGS